MTMQSASIADAP